MPFKLAQELIGINEQQSAKYMDPGQTALRRRYRAAHPSRIVVFKCMDGRVNMALLTKTPVGIMYPFRNIGGVFDLGWPALDLRLAELVDYSVSLNSPNIFMTTYHYAAGNIHRGCRGHQYDTTKAQESAAQLVRQINAVFGSGHEQVYPIMVGVETDNQTLLFHGKDGTTVSMKDHVEATEKELQDIIEKLYPDMELSMVKDVLPLLVGNAGHVRGLQGSVRAPIEFEHGERVLAVGQGFDWLHNDNYALIINDLDPELNETIPKAAGIIKENRDAGRIPPEGALFFVCVSYRFPGYRRTGAIARAKYLTKLGMEAIAHHHPDLEHFFQPLTGVIDWNTRKLEIIS